MTSLLNKSNVLLSSDFGEANRAVFGNVADGIVLDWIVLGTTVNASVVAAKANVAASDNFMLY